MIWCCNYSFEPNLIQARTSRARNERVLKALHGVMSRSQAQSASAGAGVEHSGPPSMEAEYFHGDETAELHHQMALFRPLEIVIDGMNIGESQHSGSPHSPFPPPTHPAPTH